MTSLTAGDIIVNTLHEWGVDTVFGIPGDGINGVIELLRRRKDEIRFIQVRRAPTSRGRRQGGPSISHRRRLRGLRPPRGGIHLLNGIKNNVLGQIKWDQMVFLGHLEYVCELQPIDFAAVAQGFGLASFRIDEAKACADTLKAALASAGPVLIEATVDPNEPPMPPKIEAKQAKNFAEALAKGTPGRGKIALTVLSDKVRELV